MAFRNINGAKVITFHRQPKSKLVSEESSMEFEVEDGSKFPLQSSDKTLFGRGCGFETNDHTVSRRHVSFQLNNESDSEPTKVSFQVIGINPIWVLKNNDKTIKVFKKFEMGQLELGDRFCLSVKTPFWFNLKKTEDSESEIEFDQLDISQIDPVKGNNFDPFCWKLFLFCFSIVLLC